MDGVFHRDMFVIRITTVWTGATNEDLNVSMVSNTLVVHSLSGSGDWIQNLLSLVPKDNSTVVQLDSMGVALLVFFLFISYL